MKLSKIPTKILQLNEKIKSLETHCQQFRKLHIEWKTLNHQIDQKMFTRLATAIKDHSHLQNGIYLTSALVGMAGAACYPKEYAEKCFDPSGHIMLKTLLATLTAKTLSAALEKNQNTSFEIKGSSIFGIILADFRFKFGG